MRSDGGKTRPQDLVFDGPGTKTVTTSWTLSNLQANEGQRRWIAVEILYPNHILPSSMGSLTLATAPIPGVAVFDLVCTEIARNPNVPIKLEVSLSGMGLDLGYNCEMPSFHSKIGKWFKGKITVRNLSPNPIKLSEQMPNYVMTKMDVLVMFPRNKEALKTKPSWPYVYNDPNWGPIRSGSPTPWPVMGSLIRPSGSASTCTMIIPSFTSGPFIGTTRPTIGSSAIS